MLPIKNNLSARRSNGLAYRIADCDLGNGMSAESDPITITADQGLAISWRPGASATKGRPLRTTSPSSFVKLLKGGPVPVAEIEASLRPAGLLGATQQVNQYKPFRKAKEKT
jgi:hypothetical protein